MSGSRGPAGRRAATRWWSRALPAPRPRRVEGREDLRLGPLVLGDGLDDEIAVRQVGQVPVPNTRGRGRRRAAPRRAGPGAPGGRRRRPAAVALLARTPARSSRRGPPVPPPRRRSRPRCPWCRRRPRPRAAGASPSRPSHARSAQRSRAEPERHAAAEPGEQHQVTAASTPGPVAPRRGRRPPRRCRCCRTARACDGCAGRDASPLDELAPAAAVGLVRDEVVDRRRVVRRPRRPGRQSAAGTWSSDEVPDAAAVHAEVVAAAATVVVRGRAVGCRRP